MFGLEGYIFEGKEKKKKKKKDFFERKVKKNIRRIFLRRRC